MALRCDGGLSRGYSQQQGLGDLLHAWRSHQPRNNFGFGFVWDLRPLEPPKQQPARQPAAGCLVPLITPSTLMLREEEDFVFIDAAETFEREAEAVLEPSAWPSLPSAWDLVPEYIFPGTTNGNEQQSQRKSGAPLSFAAAAAAPPSFADAVASAPLSCSPPDSTFLKPTGPPPTQRHSLSAVKEADRKARARNRPRREREHAPRWDEAPFFCG